LIPASFGDLGMLFIKDLTLTFFWFFFQEVLAEIASRSSDPAVDDEEGAVFTSKIVCFDFCDQNR
jgi:hypothetical protein